MKSTNKLVKPYENYSQTNKTHKNTIALARIDDLTQIETLPSHRKTGTTRTPTIQ